MTCAPDGLVTISGEPSRNTRGELELKRPSAQTAYRMRVTEHKAHRANMTDQSIPADLVDIALERASGQAFERFVHFFYPSLSGTTFVPLGGTSDGGADAMLSEVSRGEDQGCFFQVTVQEDYRGKIKQTLLRLAEFNRVVTELIYVTSRKISKVDAVERELSKEHGISIRMREGSYVASHVNDSVQTRGAFRDHLASTLEYLNHVGRVQSLTPSEHVRSPAVFVFLRQEIERRDGKRNLVEAVLDSLILWSLEETDPDADKLMSREEISHKITEEFPFAKQFVHRSLNACLDALSSKKRSGGREIRHHKKANLYCLPFETRQAVALEAASEEALRGRVLRGLEARVRSTGEPLMPGEFAACASLALRALQLLFEREGIEFASFLSAEAPSASQLKSLTVAESVEAAMKEAKTAKSRMEVSKATVLIALRGGFYDSSPDERLYLGKMARTYSLLFSLQAEPKIIEYFQDMAADFYLYVGTDLLVRALSERYVRPEDQRVRTLLKMLAEAGAKLVLTEPVLDEVAYHLRTTKFEYQHEFEACETSVTYEMARSCSKILIRAFFYARLEAPSGITRPSSWRQYLSQFCDYEKVGTPAGREQIRRYLLSTFAMQYETREQLSELVTGKDRATVDAVAAALRPHKATAELAENDALMALAIYGRREKNGELARTTVFGFRTWWLTAETSILRHTKEAVNSRGAGYMMRPEFLLNFLSMAPKVKDVRKTYESVFPSLLGVRLANRVRDEVYRDVMAKVREAQQLEPGRREAIISSCSDELKRDFRRVYTINLCDE